jgi:HlyD family secretion protein
LGTSRKLAVALSEDDVRRLDSLKLVPGMPAEIFIQTEELTSLQYLLKPLREQLARSVSDDAPNGGRK